MIPVQSLYDLFLEELRRPKEVTIESSWVEYQEYEPREKYIHNQSQGYQLHLHFSFLALIFTVILIGTL